MKPLEIFLSELHPDVIERGKTLVAGTEIEYGKPDNAALRHLIKEHYKEGQEALKNFRKWLVRSQALSADKAAKVAATLWNALCMTYDVEARKANPEALLAAANDTYTYYTKVNIAYALRLWAQHTQDSALYERLIVWLKRKPHVTPNYVLEEIEKSPPYTKQEYRKLLKALEEYKGAPRYPWAWPCLRMTFVCGVPPSEVIHIQHAKVRQAVVDGAPFLASGFGHRRSVLQTALVEEELRMLDSYPARWNILADIIDPVGTQTGKPRFSPMPLTRVARRVFQRAKVPYTPTWVSRVRWSAAWQYYHKTHNLVGAAQILRHRNIKRTLEFLKELDKRSGVALEEPSSAAEEIEEGGEE